MISSGLLKDAYPDEVVSEEDETPVARALRLKRQHMMDRLQQKSDIMTDKPIEEREV